MHTGIDNAFNVIQDFIQDLPFVGTLESLNISHMLPIPVQAMIYSRSISHFGVDLIIPVTVLDIGLSATVVGKVPGLAVKGLGMAAKGLGKGVQFVSNAWGRIGAQSKNIITSMDLAYRPKIVDAGIIWGKGILEQGLPWEKFLAEQGHLGDLLPKNHKTFDLYNDVSFLATSAKTLNTQTPAKLAKPEQIYYSLKRNIDAAANFVESRVGRGGLTAEKIASREVHLAIPKQTNLEQWFQIRRAVEYGERKNIKLIVTETQ